MSTTNRPVALLGFAALAVSYGAITIVTAFSALTLALPWWLAVPMLGWALYQRAWLILGATSFIGAYCALDMHLLLALVAGGIGIAFASTVIPLTRIFLEPQQKLASALSSENN